MWSNKLVVMTVDKDIGNSTTLNNLTFGQSILSEQTNGSGDSIHGINFGQSFLLDEITNDLEKDSVEDTGVKTVKTFDGTSIKLKKKIRQKNTIDLSSLGMKETDNIVNMDDLFSKIRNKQALKQSIPANLRQRIPSNGQIWTEKYRPTSFVQLCSAGNDRQYRLILHWLKKWSQVVFNEASSNDDNVDILGRPHKKLLLLHGPLGIGKTSAAQILARQLGYNVQELNAANSMDTLPQSTGPVGNPYSNASAALKLKIINALTTNSLTSNGKPTCLIIDEIDSSINSHEIVKVLNELIRLDQSSNNNKNGSTYNAKSDKKKKTFTLNRPIICIANDIYSSNGSFRNSGGSAMDKLRPLCEIIAMRKPSSYKSMSGSKRSGNASRSVKEHLMWINDRENLGMDYQQLGEIVEICEGDVRACINYLQFNGRKIDLVSNGLIQQEKLNKDIQISWFAMVDLLFKRDPQLSKDENFMVLMDLVMNGDGKSATSNNGNLDKVIRGCFNKYLDVVRVQDDSLKKPAELSDWLSFYDLTGNSNDVDYYSSLFSMKVWSLFGELNPNKFSNDTSLIPNSKNLEFESFEMMKQNKSIIKRIINQMPISLKQSVAGGEIDSSFACYFLPYLSKLLTPETIESKLKSSLKESEKRFVEKATRIVTELNLRLENHRDFETGQESLHVSPNWDSITIFDSSLLQIPASTVHKQIQLKRQWLFPIMVEEIERLDMLKKSHKRTIQAADGKLKNDLENKKKKSRLNSLEFFKGRYDEVASQINEADSNHESTRIWVKYNEGFSNAVRKNIGWNEIWI